MKAGDRLLAITEEEIKKELAAVRASIAQGHLESESIRTALIRLYTKMRRRRRLDGISDRMRKAYDTYITEVLKLLFLHLDHLSSNPSPFTLSDVACRLFDDEIDQVKCPLTQDNLTKYCSTLRVNLQDSFPILKKMKKLPKRVLKTRDQLEDEARIVHKLVFEAGDKFLPDREGVRYHVISMQWVTKWKEYVDYERLIGSIEECKTKASTADASVTTGQ